MKVALVLLLVAPAASLHVQKNVCDCLPWKSAYNDHNVMCGQGYELGVGGPLVTRMARRDLPYPEASFYDEFCTRMYQQISFSGCFNKGFGTPTKQWCYVDHNCQGTDPVEGTDLAIKSCSEGDNFMNDTAPEELDRLADVDHLEIGLFGKLSYAMEPDLWSDVEAASGLSNDKLQQTHIMESYYGLQWSGPKQVTQAATDKLRATRASGVATIFDTDNHHGGGTLILGTRTYMFGPRTDGGEGMAYVELV